MAELKIATKAFCNTLHAGSFSGDTTQCPTKSEILSAGLSIKAGTYEDNQLVPEDHIQYLWWEHTFSVSPTAASQIPATGGSRQFTVTSYKVQYSKSTAGDKVEVTRQNVGYTSSNSGSGSWNSGNNTITYGANNSTGGLSGTITWTQNESSKKVTATHSQAAGTKTYSGITISSASANTAPCGGGTVNSGSVSYSQTWGWNGSTTGGGTITSGLSVSWTSVSIGSLGTTTTSSSTDTGKDITVTVSGNGKTASKTVNVYQAANQYSDSWGSWSYTISNITVGGGSGDIPYSGGTRTVSASCTGSRGGTRKWCSGSTQSISDSSSPSVSWSISGSGFSLSGTTVSASTNNGGRRCCTVTASYPGATSKTAQICQAEGAISYGNYRFSTSPISIDFSSSGGSNSFTVTSVATKYIGSTSQGDVSISWSGSKGGTNSSSFSVSPLSGGNGTRVNVSIGSNSDTRNKNATVNLIQEGSGTSINVPLRQAEYVITDSIKFTLYSATGNINRVVFDGGSISLGNTYERKIFEGIEISLYIPYGSTSSNTVTINTYNIKMITGNTSNFTYRFNGGLHGGLTFEFANGFPSSTLQGVSYNEGVNFNLSVGSGG